MNLMLHGDTLYCTAETTDTHLKPHVLFLVVNKHLFSRFSTFTVLSYSVLTLKLLSSVVLY